MSSRNTFKMFLIGPYSRRTSALLFTHREASNYYRPTIIHAYRMLRRGGCTTSQARYLLWEIMTAGEHGRMPSIAESKEIWQAKTAQ
jgi:hypothetical protein